MLLLLVQLKHGASVWWLKQHVKELAGAEIDPQARDLPRLCYVSHDPGLFLNLGAVEIPEQPPAPKDAWKEKGRRGKPRAKDSAADAAAEAEDSCPVGDQASVTAWMRGKILKVIDDRRLGQEGKCESIAGIVVVALNHLGRFFYHTEKRDFSTALFFHKSTKRLDTISSDEFNARLSSRWPGSASP